MARERASFRENVPRPSDARLSQARVLLVLLAAFARGEAAISLAPLFTDHAVLQRDKPVPVWGRAEPGERVTVVFRGQTVAASADRDGRWMAWLGPAFRTPAGADLSVAGERAGRLSFTTSWWARSGCARGSRTWSLSSTTRTTRLSACRTRRRRSNAARFPLIRQFKVARQLAAAPAETAGATGFRARPRQPPISRPWATSSPGRSFSRSTCPSASRQHLGRNRYRIMDQPGGARRGSCVRRGGRAVAADGGTIFGRPGGVRRRPG